jgi:hypothetical protein
VTDSFMQEIYKGVSQQRNRNYREQIERGTFGLHRSGELCPAQVDPVCAGQQEIAYRLTGTRVIGYTTALLIYP